MDINKREKALKENWLVKAPKSLKEKFDEVRRRRIISGKDKEMTNYKRLLLAISRDDVALNRLANADFIDDTKAQFSVFNIFTFIITALVVVLFFAGLIYVHGLIYGVLLDVGIQNEANAGQAGYTNFTLAAQQTFGVINDSIQSLRMVALVYIMSLAILIIITNALIKIHPLFFFIYVLIIVLAIIFAVPISNAYYDLLNSGVFGGILPSFTGANWIVLNLPYVVLIVGILGGVFLFINMVRRANQEVLR